MKRTLGAVLTTSALILVACDGPIRFEPPKGAKSAFDLRVIDRLTCPVTEGQLKRVSMADDGQSCRYEAAETEIELRLVRLDQGDAQAALAPLEADLKALMPNLPPPSKIEPSGSKANIHLPWVNIKAGDDGAKIQVGSVHIDANHEWAEIRTARNITESETEAKGSNARRRNIQATYILAREGDHPGYHIVGYEALGPKGGPIAVGIVKARARKNESHDLLADVKALLKANVGGGSSSITIS